MGNTSSQILNKDPDLAKFVHFSPIEMKEWKATFKALYPSGRMNYKEFEDVFSKLFPLGRVTKFCERLFQNINISQSKFVDINELLIAFTILWKGSSFEQIRWIFRFYDNDNDGFVSREDLFKGISIINEMVSNSTFTEIDAKKLIEELFEIVQNESGFLNLNDFEILSVKEPGKLKKLTGTGSDIVLNRGSI